MATKDKKSFLLKSLTVLIRPLVNYAVRNSIKIQDCLEALKEEYIFQASHELERRGENASTSKISVMTGLHRRDVDRLKENSNPRKFGSDLLTKVIGQWQLNRKFSTKGRAKKLTVSGTESDFFALVQSVSKNLNPYTVLFELERADLIERDGDFITLKRQQLDIASNSDESLSLLGEDLTDLSRAVEENITSKHSLPNLHAKTYFDNVSPKFEETIRKWFLDKGKAFHDDARKFLAQFDIDLNEKLKHEAGGMKITVGTFSRVEDKHGDQKE